MKGRMGWGTIVLSNVLAVPTAMLMALIVYDHATNVFGGARVLDPKEVHHTGISLIETVLVPFALYLIYFMNLGTTVQQANRAAICLLIVVVPQLAYSAYTVYGIFAMNDFWLISRDNPGSMSQAVGIVLVCGFLSFGPIHRRRAILAPDKTPPRLCRTCGYNLTGLTEARCPECGNPFDPRLLGDEPSGQRGMEGEASGVGRS